VSPKDDSNRLTYDGIDEYQDVFIKVAEFGKFQPSDISRNGIEVAQGSIPDFVKEYQDKLGRKPSISKNVSRILNTLFWFPLLTNHVA
jgi:hypothetical protein